MNVRELIQKHACCVLLELRKLLKFRSCFSTQGRGAACFWEQKAYQWHMPYAVHVLSANHSFDGNQGHVKKNDAEGFGDRFVTTHLQQGIIQTCRRVL